MAVLVGVFGGQPPVPAPLVVWLSKPRQICSLCWGVGVSAVGMASIWEQWLLHGSRLWEDGGAQHFCGAFGLPGGGYQFYLFIGLFCCFRAYLSLAILMASGYEIVLCCHRIGCYTNLCVVVGYGVMHMVGVVYIIGGQGVYFTSFIGLGSVA